MSCDLLSVNGAADCMALTFGALGLTALVVITLSLAYEAFFRKPKDKK